MSADQLREFLAELASDPEKLGHFIHDPDAAMEEAELAEENRSALRSGFGSIIAARLAGMSIEEAFRLILRIPQIQSPFQISLQLPQFVAPQFVSPQFVAPQFVSPQFVAPQFVFPPPPQFVAPQFVQPPPQFVVNPFNPQGR